MKYDAVAEARKYLYVREAPSQGQNRGLRVEAIQKWSGGQSGDSWCLEFVWMVLDVCFQGTPPFDRLQACEALHQLAIAKGWITTTPTAGDLFLRVTPQGHAHHVGVITQLYPDRVRAIAGNTSEDGQSSNGDRVAEHELALDASLVFVAYPRGAA
jgi:hypothetical protein